MTDFIIAGILVIIVGVAVIYIVRSKKSGAKCIGCPAGGCCSSKSNKESECCCGCHSDTKEDGQN